MRFLCFALQPTVFRRRRIPGRARAGRRGGKPLQSRRPYGGTPGACYHAWHSIWL